MIKFWLAQRPPFFIPDEETFNNGSIKLLHMIWYEGLGDPYNIRVSTHILNKGYKI